MKIIYDEDGPDRPQADGRPGAVPTPPNASAPAQGELPNLTPEQISALLQILANQQTAGAQPAPQPDAPKEAPKKNSSPAPEKDPGTRILYQSADFEPLESKKSKTHRRPVPDPGMRIAYQAKDPDELREERERRRTAQQGSFSVNEFSLMDDTPDEPPVFGDLAVGEVDEATEAFRTQHAKRVRPAPQTNPPAAPELPQKELSEPAAPQKAPEPPTAADITAPAPQEEPPVQAAPQAAPPAAPQAAPPAKPPITPIPAVAVGENADAAALKKSAQAQHERLMEAARRREALDRAEREAQKAAEAERAREEQERLAREAEEKEAAARQKEAEKAAAKAEKKQAKLNSKAEKAAAKAEEKQAKRDTKAEKAAAKAEKKAGKAQAKAERKPWSPTRKIVLTISLIAILASCGVLAWEYKLHKDNLKLEDEVSGLILETQIAPPMVGGNTIVLTEEQQWAQLRGEFPGVVFPEGLQLKYARLYATNPDFVGYLEIPGLNTSLPVVQTNNDADYLNKNFFGKSTKYGCPFVSCINNIAALDFNTVIYGHHMNDRTIFGALDAYKTIDGYRSAPVIEFNTMFADHKWKVVAAFLTNSVPADDNGYVFNYYFNQLSTDEKKIEYFAALKERSLYDTGVDLLPTDKLLTLSTCSHVFENARLVVVARMVRPGESAETDTSLATLNPDVRYPQVYYTKKKQTNPYANSPRWEVG